MEKKVDVKAHLRGGKAVRKHVRTTKDQEAEPSNISGSRTKSDAGNALFYLATPIVPEEKIITDTKGNTVDLSKVSELQNMTFLELDLKDLDLSHIKNISNCSFSRSILDNVILDSAVISNCTFDSTILRGVKLHEAHLSHCNFRTSSMLGNMSGPDWENTKFSHCDFTGGTIRGMRSTNTTFADCSFGDSKIEQTDLIDSVFLRANINDLQIAQSDLRDSKFEECEINELRLFGIQTRSDHRPHSSPLHIKKSNIKDSTFNKVYMADSTIEDTNMDNVRFYDIKARHTRWQNVHLEDCRFSSCTYQENSFDGVKFLRPEIFSTEIEDSVWKNTSLLDLPEDFNKRSLSYEEISFEDFVRETNLTKNQFEYLVLSGSIEARDNMTGKRIRSDFNPDNHHVPIWELSKASRIVSAQNNRDDNV